LLFIIQFFFSFFPGWGSVCPGGYADLAQGCLWEYCMPLSLPGGLLLPSMLGAGIWRRESPPGFCLTWSGDAILGLGVWCCWSFTSSWWFFLQGLCTAPLQDFTLGSMLSASSLLSPSWNPLSY
jgi:hypothetical protein